MLKKNKPLIKFIYVIQIYEDMTIENKLDLKLYLTWLNLDFLIYKNAIE